MKSEKNDWYIDFKNCPHCQANINIAVISDKSDKDCILKIVEYMTYHRTGCSPKSNRKRTNIIIRERKRTSTSSITKYISSTLFI
jgi:hypothetical protein